MLIVLPPPQWACSTFILPSHKCLLVSSGIALIVSEEPHRPHRRAMFRQLVKGLENIQYDVPSCLMLTDMTESSHWPALLLE